MHKYVKVFGYKNWFLLLEKGAKEPANFSSNMDDISLRSVTDLLNKEPDTQDGWQRIQMLALHTRDYEALTERYGTLLIRPNSSYMTLTGNQITEEKYDSHFPVNNTGQIVICENDRVAEKRWVKYLTKRFPDKTIVTINYFDMKSEAEILLYFKDAEYITFSTTFSRFDWFETLTRLIDSQKVIGYCSDSEKWAEAKIINPNVEIVGKI